MDPRWSITTKLWGVADTAPYLHDGRAKTLEEAIVAHGGEAEPARQAFQAMSTDDQEHLVQFLKSLWSPDALTAEKGRISRIFSIDGQKYAVD